MIYWHNLIISAVMNGVMSTWSPVYWPDIEMIIAREDGVPELTAPWSAWWQSIAKCLNRFASVTSQVKSEAFSEKNKKDDEHAYIVKRQTISIILLLSTLRPVSESWASSAWTLVTEQRWSRFVTSHSQVIKLIEKRNRILLECLNYFSFVRFIGHFP